MTDIRIDSHIKLPRSKRVVKDSERRQKLFKAYQSVYQKLYVVKPDSYTVDANGLMTIRAGDRICEIASEKRIKQIIRMMQNRINEREQA
jgi:hypothetical protein